MSRSYGINQLGAMYPFKFKSVRKTPIWGSEEWLVSAIKGSESKVMNGEYAGRTLPSLIVEYGVDIVGKQVFDRFGDQFPLLIKFIKANDDLSIQVHPNDLLAQQRHGCMGKNEMWYVLGAGGGAKLLSGFKKEITKDEYIAGVENNTIVQVLNNCKVQPGDVFFLPAGRVHAIGGGCFILEVQQSSDITYRIYDYGRRDIAGNGRELHTELAVDAIDYSVVQQPCGRVGVVEPGDLVRCNYFCVNELCVNGALDFNYAALDSFVVLVSIEGGGFVKWQDKATAGSGYNSLTLDNMECVFLPASLGHVVLEGNMRIVAAR
ncbi:MAG: type I phosphomannose isomerase catalytic subunit [Bacteroidales bacterium]